MTGGNSVISPDVLARYAADAASEVAGVHPKRRRGPRGTGSEVEVHLVVDYGADIPQVAADVQRHVVEYLERMAEVTPSAVNVVTDDVQR
jgi:uncharacterized alkaline shock family protein YloU